MPEITVLSQETIDKIAAGEVVERPSSVVKELVENAIDATATAVTVEIREGGISFIRITDNGCGIARPQVPVAFLRHSTSKIKSVEDLFHVTSLGFRGEALSSIAAVAQVELITRTYSELTGTRYVIEGSREKENEEIGAPDGTTFIVRNLFYNTPARRKFLKTAQTEGNYVNDLMERLALSHPDVSFKFINNGQTKLHTSGNSNKKDLIYHIYGREITSSLLPVEAESAFFSIKGFIGKPSVSRGNRNFENYFVNGRYIKSNLLSKATEEAYKGFLMQRQYPFCVLYLDMDKELLDVNVHPTKMELRFSRSEEIFRELCRLIKGALTQRELIPEVPVEEEKEEKRPAVRTSVPEPFEKKRLDGIRSAVAKDSPYQKKYPQREEGRNGKPEPGASGRFFEKLTPQRAETANHKDIRREQPESPQRTKTQTMRAEFKSADAVGEAEMYMEDPTAASASGQAAPVAEQPVDVGRKEPEPCRKSYDQQTFLTRENGFLTESAVRKHRIIGQLFDTYWLVEYEDKLFVIDQHAAHEKVLYEKMMARLKNREFASQAVSPPVILTLGIKEQEMLEKYGEHIRTFGYEIEPFGGKEYAIKAVPADFDGVDKKSMFLELLDDFSGLGGKAPEQILEKTASMSCKAAVKGSQRLSRPEMEELISELLSLDNPYHCPHGRPTIISMSRYEIEKKFKRIV